MITFEEWMVKNHPELINEIKFSDMAKKLTLAAATIGGISGANAVEPIAQVSKEHQFEKATTLRQIYEMAKKNYDNGVRNDIAILVRQLRTLGPEYYNPGSEYAVTTQDLAGMPDDAYSDFLLNLKNNYEEQEKMERMPVSEWKDKDGTITFKAKFLKYDHMNKTKWVWLQKENGQKVRVPFEWLSPQNQQQINNIYKLSLGVQ